MKLLKFLGVFVLFTPIVYAQQFHSNTGTYTLPLHTDKPLNVQVTIKTQNSFCATRFEFLTSDNELLLKDEFMMNKEKVTYDVPLKSGDYLLVYTGRSGCTNKHFDISLVKSEGDFEQELNDTPSLATSMQENHFYTGALQKYKDEDYYKIIIEKKSNVEFVFGHKVFQGFGSFGIDVLDGNSKKITSFTSTTSSAKDIKKVSLNAGTYFVKVSSPNFYSSVKQHKYNLSYRVSK